MRDTCYQQQLWRSGDNKQRSLRHKKEKKKFQNQNDFKNLEGIIQGFKRKYRQVWAPKGKGKKKKFSLGNCYIYIPTIYIYTYKRIL